ncbi:alpha/beta fold hydrolase [Streptomyces sp. NPDC058240]|uniref:alpha/beta fold hydrolase n=1 Tax=Streptomyces sp. NPDC058240 TaxID=3346396 RepID=UPI0036EC021D
MKRGSGGREQPFEDGARGVVGPAAREAFDRVWTGAATDADFDASAPFFYGRWDAGAQEHAASEAGQTNEEAAAGYAAPGAFDLDAARVALAGRDVPVLVLAGELDGGPLPRVATGIAELFPAGEPAVQLGAGHFPWLDDPCRFARTVEAFLARSR